MNDDQRALRAFQAPPGLGRIVVLYALGIASLACAIVGGAMAWEAITWQPASVGELPPMLMQFCIGGAAATASGLLAISCLVPALVFHAERRLGPTLPPARVVCSASVPLFHTHKKSS